MIKRLFVINLKNLAGSMFQNSGKKASKGKTVLFSILFAYTGGVFLLMFGMLFNQLCGAFYDLGLGWLYFAVFAILSFALCVIESIFTVQSLIFTARDNELLLAMPIRPSAIVISRILTLLVYEYIFNFLVAIPAIFVWWRSGHATAGGTFILLLEILLVPLLALALACLLGWLVALLTKSMRAKNLFNLVFSLGFLAVYLYFYINIQKYLALLVENGAEIADAIRRAVFPAYHFGVAVEKSSVLSLLIFAACAIIPFAAMCVVLSKSFIKIATAKRGAPKIEYRERALKASGARAALLKIELKRFFGNAMVLMNVGLGSIAAIILGVILLVRPALVTNITQAVNAVIPGVSPTALVGAAIMMLCSMTTYSAAAISLEGKTLWLVKSLPVKSGDVLLTKVAAHVLIGGAPALFAALACAARLGGGALDVLAVIFAPLALCVATGFFGLIVNLAFPNLGWTNEVQAVKQGVGMLISVFGVMAFVIAFVLVYAFAARRVMGVSAYMLVCAAALLALSGLMYAYLTRGGARKFEKL